MNTEDIEKRISSIEALANLLLKEASQLRKELGLIQVPAPRKGAKDFEMRLAQVLAKRNQLIDKTGK